MKKLLLAVITCLSVSLAFAQTTPSTDTLQIYTGLYRFPDGSVVTSVKISLENGILSAVSDMGSTELKLKEGDVFEVVAYSGLATFKRSAEGKINGVKIEVSDILLEGVKDTTVTSLSAIQPIPEETTSLRGGTAISRPLDPLKYRAWGRCLDESLVDSL